MIRQEIRFYGNVQGNPETIEKLISRIEERPFIIIENMDVKEIPVLENEWEFFVKDSF